MQFLALNEIEKWCNEHAVALDEGGNIEPCPFLIHRSYAVYAESGRSGREPGLAEACTRALGEWDECLLWVTQWGIWPSSEDWPSYYALRGNCGERRSLEEAPGHLFTASDRDTLIAFLTAVMENGWDAQGMTVGTGTYPGARAVISHDGWVETLAPYPVDLTK